MWGRGGGGWYLKPFLSFFLSLHFARSLFLCVCMCRSRGRHHSNLQAFCQAMAARFASLALRRSPSSPRIFSRFVSKFARDTNAARAAASNQNMAVFVCNRFTKHCYPNPSTVDHTAVLSTPATKVTTLPSGLRVATESYLSSQTATVGVWIDTGSRFETHATNGTGHFLEHMAFKGTKNRSLRQLQEEIANLGGLFHAYTSREQTAYYAKVMKEDVPATLEVLADILQNSTFSPDGIERERNAILKEMQEVEGQIEDSVFEQLHGIAFRNNPLGRTILGPPENIKSMTKSNLEDYMSANYTAPRMIVVATGAIEHEEVAQLVEKLFVNLPTDPTTGADLVQKQPITFTGSQVHMKDGGPLAHIAVAFLGAPWTDPDSIPLLVMQAMLGCWSPTAAVGKYMGSELAQKVSTNNLAESIASFNTNYADAGLFGVYAVAQPDKVESLSQTIMSEFTRLIYRFVDEELIRARNLLKGSLLLHLDGTSPIAEDIGRQLLTYGRRIPLAEIIARIDAVDADTIKRVAMRFIYDKDIAMIVRGPAEFLPDYSWFRRRTYWLKK